MKYLNKNEYEVVLYNQYNDSSSDDIINILTASKKYILFFDNKNIISEDKIGLIKSIIVSAHELRKLSFKQWKALKAFNKQCMNEMLPEKNKCKTF